MNDWNFMSPDSKENLLGVVRRQADAFFTMVAEPGTWEAPTGAGHWQVRDVVAHLVETTEGYFVGFDAARNQNPGGEPLGVRGMSRYVDEGALAFRSTPQEELVERLRSDFDKMLGVFEPLTIEEWGGLSVPHKYMGPLPAFFYPIFQLVDYTVHGWDIREGSGRSHAMDGDAADLLVPLCPVMWQSTAQCGADTDFTIGIRVLGGRSAGDFQVSASPQGVSVQPGLGDGVDTVLELDPASLVLTTFGRVNAGTARGDPGVVDGFCNLFFRI